MTGCVPAPQCLPPTHHRHKHLCVLTAPTGRTGPGQTTQAAEWNDARDCQRRWLPQTCRKTVLQINRCFPYIDDRQLGNVKICGMRGIQGAGVRRMGVDSLTLFSGHRIGCLAWNQPSWHRKHLRSQDSELSHGLESQGHHANSL